MAKAELEAQAIASEVRDIALDAIRRTHGKVATAAEILALHEAQVGRLAKDGDLKLKHFEALGPATLAQFGRELMERFGPLSSPRQRFEWLKRQRHQIDSELDQFTESVLDSRSQREA